MSAIRPLVDVAGRPRSPATMPGFHAGRAPRNKGQRYPADPPTVNEIVAVMRQAKHARYGARLSGLIVVHGYYGRVSVAFGAALIVVGADLDALGHLAYLPVTFVDLDVASGLQHDWVFNGRFGRTSLARTRCRTERSCGSHSQ